MRRSCLWSRCWLIAGALFSCVSGSTNLLKPFAGSWETDCIVVRTSPFLLKSRLALTVTPGAEHEVSFQKYMFKNSLTCDISSIFYQQNLQSGGISAAMHDDILWIDLSVDQLSVTAYGLAPALLNLMCPEDGQWTAGESIPLQQSCEAMSIPGQIDCPVFYLAMKFQKATDSSKHDTIIYGEQFQIDGHQISCTAEGRSEAFDLRTPYKRTIGSPTPVPIPLPTPPTPTPAPTPPQCSHLSQLLPNGKPNLCQNFIDYPVNNPNESPPFVALLGHVWSVLQSKECKLAVGHVLCSSAYPRCVTPVLPLCKTMCDMINTHCIGDDVARFDALSSLASGHYTQFCAARDQTSCRDGAFDPIHPLPANEKLAELALNSIREPKCAAYTGQVCKGVINHPVYVPEGGSIELLEQQVKDHVYFAFALAAKRPGSFCQESLAKFACSQIYLRCSTSVFSQATSLSIPMPFPLLPCRSLCHDYTRDCRHLLAIEPSLRQDCYSEGRYLAGQPDFPASTYNLTFVTGISFPALCYNFSVPQLAMPPPSSSSPLSTALAPLSIKYTCLYPSQRADPGFSGNFGSGCATPCPRPIFTPGEYHMVDMMYRVMAPLSFFGLLFICTTIVVDPSKRKQPIQRYLLNLFSIILLIFTALLMATLVAPGIDSGTNSMGVFSLSCASPTRMHNGSSSGLCFFSGMVSLFGLVACGFWWTIYNVELFLTVTLLKKKMTPSQKTKLEILYYTVGYLPAVIWCTYLALSPGEQFLHANSLVWCWVNKATDEALWDLVSILSAVDFLLLFSTVYTTWKSMHRSTVAGGDISLRRRVQLFRRPLTFIAIMCIFFFSIVVYRLTSPSTSHVASLAFQEWLLCWTVKLPAGLVDTCSAQVPHQISANSWFAANFLFGSIGVVMFGMFGATGAHLVLWREKCRSVKKQLLAKKFLDNDDSQHSRSDEGSSRPSVISIDPNLPIAQLRRQSRMLSNALGIGTLLQSPDTIFEDIDEEEEEDEDEDELSFNRKASEHHLIINRQYSKKLESMLGIRISERGSTTSSFNFEITKTEKTARGRGGDTSEEEGVELFEMGGDSSRNSKVSTVPSYKLYSGLDSKTASISSATSSNPSSTLTNIPGGSKRHHRKPSSMISGELPTSILEGEKEEEEEEENEDIVATVLGEDEGIEMKEVETKPKGGRALTVDDDDKDEEEEDVQPEKSVGAAARQQHVESVKGGPVGIVKQVLSFAPHSKNNSRNNSKIYSKQSTPVIGGGDKRGVRVGSTKSPGEEKTAEEPAAAVKWNEKQEMFLNLVGDDESSDVDSKELQRREEIEKESRSKMHSREHSRQLSAVFFTKDEQEQLFPESLVDGVDMSDSGFNFQTFPVVDPSTVEGGRNSSSSTSGGHHSRDISTVSSSDDTTYLLSAMPSRARPLVAVGKKGRPSEKMQSLLSQYSNNQEKK